MPDTRVSFADRKVYAIPDRWEDLHGPAQGILELPVGLYWVPERAIDLSRIGQIRTGYRAVLCEGRVQDQQRYLNPDLLKAIWAEMLLPPRVRSLWRERFPQHLPESPYGAF